MGKIYLYVVARDLGFAPNPFHGLCTLATCKWEIRNTASIGDWIIGVGGSRLKATGKCIFGMKISEKITYNEYWSNPNYNIKKPLRNGSKIMMVGDNIYFKNSESNSWLQAHSHHSNVNGSINKNNLARDTNSNKVLISNHFYYFGESAPAVPQNIIDEIRFTNRRKHYVYEYITAKAIVDWLENNFNEQLNLVLFDPFDFSKSDSHYSYETNKIT